MGKNYPGYKRKIISKSLQARSGYLTFIRDEKFSCVSRSRFLIGEITVHGKIFAPYEHSLFNTFPLSRKTVPYEQNKMFSR